MSALGLRGLGGWLPSTQADILQTVTARIARLGAALQKAADHHPVVLSLPDAALPAN
ncbi:MAG: hypothetical protein R2882_10095 [Gemmatimonadales bacterium]